jgi:nitroimidazol reductase NimA-like FMN-containing flavoprotein (pyridoxamine 5'-phosphate oxidase superfamily)
MSTTPKPHIRSLTREECESILARNHVGRLAYSWGNHLDIEPLHYVFDGTWLYGRTSHGAKLTAMGELWRPVAFEVDEVEGIFSWRSVVVHGGFHTVTDDGPEWRQEAWRTGVGLLRTLIPETFTSDDPTPSRNVMLRIAAQDLTGREATPAGAEPAGPR